MESVHHYQARQQNDVTDTILICYYIHLDKFSDLLLVANIYLNKRTAVANIVF